MSRWKLTQKYIPPKYFKFVKFISISTVVFGASIFKQKQTNFYNKVSKFIANSEI
jgi:hypothetical protein